MPTGRCARHLRWRVRSSSRSRTTYGAAITHTFALCGTWGGDDLPTPSLKYRASCGAEDADTGEALWLPLGGIDTLAWHGEDAATLADARRALGLP